MAARQITRISKTCERCGTIFSVNRYRALNRCVRFCSLECRITQIMVSCAKCSKPFSVELNRKETARFCSKSCIYEYRHIEAVGRFWGNVDKTESCWLWTGLRDKNGYGYMSFKNRNTRAHRFAYKLEHGDIPQGYCVMHLCDNPPCVRPDHLRIGTNADNTRDKVQKRRQQKGAQIHTAKLTEAQVHQIIELSESRTAGELAREFHVSLCAIYDVRRGNSWKHLLQPPGQQQDNQDNQ